jgi:hypothetical protein
MIFDLSLRRANSPHPPEEVAQAFDFQEFLGSNRVLPQGLVAYTRMRSADSLDVAACVSLDQSKDDGDLKVRAAIQLRRPVYTLRRQIKNDTSILVRLSKSAHK